MALIPAAQSMLAIFLAAIVVGGMLTWLFEFIISKIKEAMG
jgi:hypothetical protein